VQHPQIVLVGVFSGNLGCRAFSGVFAGGFDGAFSGGLGLPHGGLGGFFVIHNNGLYSSASFSIITTSLKVNPMSKFVLNFPRAAGMIE
jgi:hypothetical protein